MRRARALAGAGLALLLTAAIGLFLAQRALERWLEAPGPLAQERIVQIPRGGLEGVVAALEQAGAVEPGWAFALAVRLRGKDRVLKAGEYRIEPGASPAAILALLESGRVVLHRITVPEGLTTAEVHEILARAEVLEGPLPEPGPEGTLLPETWLVPRGEPRVRVLERMRAAMRATLEELWANRAPGLPYADPREALILASLIERETPKKEEQPLVAAVFVNRLKRGMRLQSDPTVIFALTSGRNRLDRPLTRKDLEVDHPFNTYRIDGLPPAPIANPGRSALAAALAFGGTAVAQTMGGQHGAHIVGVTGVQGASIAHEHLFARSQR